jgi:hypothetical protein
MQKVAHNRHNSLNRFTTKRIIAVSMNGSIMLTRMQLDFIYERIIAFAQVAKMGEKIEMTIPKLFTLKRFSEMYD